MTRNKLLDDPRVDPRIKAFFAGLPEATAPQIPSREIMLAAVAARAGQPAAGVSLTGILATADFEQVSPSAGLDVRTESIVSAPDGNRINLQIITPSGAAPGPRPCVYYIQIGRASCRERVSVKV